MKEDIVLELKAGQAASVTIPRDGIGRVFRGEPRELAVNVDTAQDLRRSSMFRVDPKVAPAAVLAWRAEQSKANPKLEKVPLAPAVVKRIEAADKVRAKRDKAKKGIDK